MQIVIDIPEEKYMEYKRIGDSRDVLFEAIRKGTPLPKKHGRLIDADALEKRMLDREIELNDDRALWESSAVSVALDMFGKTIVEAESEE